MFGIIYDLESPVREFGLEERGKSLPFVLLWPIKFEFLGNLNSDSTIINLLEFILDF